MHRLATLTIAFFTAALLLTGARCGGSPPQRQALRSAAVEDLRRDEVAFLIREATVWVKAQRDLHRPDGRPLTPKEKRRFAGFFAADLLDDARVKAVRAIGNPDFYAVYEEANRPFPIDFSRAVGLALEDTIVILKSRIEPRNASLMPLLFHELVHLVQYRMLGTEGYFESYVRSWARNGSRYRAIPFEAQAYELQARFRRAPQRIFPVEDEVRRLVESEAQSTE